MMRVAVFSDVHGFNLALEVVLADIAEHGPFDAVIAAGDHCELGPAPELALDLLREREIVLLKGNTDVAIVEGAAEKSADPELQYAINRLGSERINDLAGLPFSHRITPPGGRAPQDDLLVVHANPHDLYEPLDPSLSDDELLGIIGETEAAAIAFGHIHICYIRSVAEYLLVDVSAVGNPKDGDLRCKYGILAWNEGARSWSAELRKLPYPLEATERQIKERGVPEAEKVIKKLRRATYKNHG
jgi:predicted phosphodiesterase